MRGRSHRHRARHRCPRRRSRQPDREQDPTRRFGDPGDNRIQPTRAETGRLEVTRGARHTPTAEPAEKLLRSVSGHHSTHPDPQDQAGNVTAGNRRHVVTVLRGKFQPPHK